MDSETKQILIDIRDNQRESLRRQEEHLAIAREQIERAKKQMTESIQLQREAVGKARTIGRIVLPLLAFLVVLLIYLIVRYF
jgi:hypothetical protein